MRRVALLFLALLLVVLCGAIVIGFPGRKKVAEQSPRLVPARALLADAYDGGGDGGGIESGGGDGGGEIYYGQYAYYAQSDYAEPVYGNPLIDSYGNIVCQDAYCNGSPIDTMYAEGTYVVDEPILVDRWGNLVCTDSDCAMDRAPYAEGAYYDEPYYYGGPGYYDDDPYLYGYSNYGRYDYRDSWYDSYFPGYYGNMARNIIPGLRPTSAPARPIYTVYNPPPPPPAPIYPTPRCTISVSPTSVGYGGSTVVSWNATYATSASLSGIGTVPPSGSRSVSNLTSTETFTLDVSGPGGSAVCDARVSVAPASGPVSCVLSVHPESIRKGEQASLVWGSENAVSATFSDSGAAALSGARTIAPRSTQTYSLTVKSKDGKTATCQSSIMVR